MPLHSPGRGAYALDGLPLIPARLPRNLLEGRQSWPESVKIVRTVRDLRKVTAKWRKAGKTVALVPTMGALHAGHISLVRLAKKKADKAVVSIFVNPTQFAPHEDLARYPRDEAGDLEKLAKVGADLVWSPSVEEMYPEGTSTRIEAGKRRGGPRRRIPPAPLRRRCDGMLQAIQSGHARFRDLRREGLSAACRAPADGSRSRYAAEASRRADQPRKGRPSAVVAQRLPDRGRASHCACSLCSSFSRRPESCSGHRRSRQRPSEARAELTAAGFQKIDYIEVRDAETLVSGRAGSGKPLRVLAAAWLGKTRLIDNVAV